MHNYYIIHAHSQKTISLGVKAPTGEKELIMQTGFSNLILLTEWSISQETGKTLTIETTCQQKDEKRFDIIKHNLSN